MASSSKLRDYCYLTRHPQPKVDWSELPYDLLHGILVKLVSVVDSINFHRVCRSWRIVGREYLNRYVPYGFPCLLIPGTDLYRDTSSQSRHILSFPVGANLRDNFLPRVTVPHLDLCRGSYLGWLVMINNNMDMYLLNPFSNTHIDLPSVRTLKPHPPEKVMSKWYINRIFLSASPSEYSNYYVLVFYNYASELALYKVGSKTSWQYLPPLPCSCSAIDAAYFNGKWHISVQTGEIYICHLNDILRTIDLIEFSRSVPLEGSHFLVESRGELFRIREFFVYKWSGDDINVAAAGVEYCEEKHLHDVKGFEMTIKINDADDKHVIDRFDYDNFNGCEHCSRSKMLETDHFLVYKLDKKSNETKPSWIEVNNLDGDALFLGSTQSFLLPNPQLFGYERNHIYFTDSIVRQH